VAEGKAAGGYLAALPLGLEWRPPITLEDRPS
jgi:hypothetical protein